MKLTKIFAFAIVVCFVASAAWATPTIKVAPNGKGDVVMYPFFMGAASLQTKLTLVNTNQNSSSVAKLVVRSHKYSKELLDFFIYLSPGDVWNGTLKWDAETEDIIMYSEDGSAQSAAGTWASSTDPMNVALFDDELKVDDAGSYGDSKLFGYVYAINAATSSGDVEAKTGKEVVTLTVDGIEKDYNVNKAETPKAAVKKWFDSLTDDEINDYNRNNLAGWMDFNLAGYMTSRLEATTFADYDVVEKPELGKDTVIGMAAENGLAEFEAILAKTNIVMPYQNTNSNYSLHFFTFPTKFSTLTEVDDDDNEYVVEAGGATVRGYGAGTTYPVSPFFTNGTNFDQEFIDYSNVKELCAIYTPTVYNMEEEKAEDPERIFSPFRTDTGLLCSEVNFLPATSFEYEEGVAHYAFPSFVDADDVNYTGAPVLPFVMELGTNGLSMAYAAWDEGSVTNDENEPIAVYPEPEETNAE